MQARAPAQDPALLLETLKRVAIVLKRERIPFALGGGFAVFARGGPASVHDVDFAVREADAQQAQEALSEAGLRPESNHEDWLVKVYDDDRLVDLIHRIGTRPVDDEMLAHAEELEVGSVTMPVLTATDLTIGKLDAFSAHNADFSAVLPMIRALREQVNWPLVCDRTLGSPYAVAFLVLCTLLDIAPQLSPQEVLECAEKTSIERTGWNGSSPRTPAPPSSASG